MDVQIEGDEKEGGMKRDGWRRRETGKNKGEGGVGNFISPL